MTETDITLWPIGTTQTQSVEAKPVKLAMPSGSDTTMPFDVDDGALAATATR